MSYQVIARKYRPQRFADVVGQDHVTQTLANAIAQKRIAHAYLFCGPRGTGKTTIARIFAKCLNCTGGPKVDFADTDSRCVEIAEGRSIDVLEIDGASNNGVEQVRELRETVRYAPASSQFKIYIIDEVHMLSTAAFNALLKTLEEPPAHVKFMFATTDPEKVLPTILSRCQRFDLRRIPSALIVQHLAHIARQEGVQIDDAALYAVARGADGAMRDAESALDQLISFCGQEIAEADVLAMFGLAAHGQILALAEAVIAGTPEPALRHLDELARHGKDLGRLLADLLHHFRNLLIYEVAHADLGLLEVSEAEAAALKTHAGQIDAPAVTRVMEVLSDSENRLREAVSKRILLEVSILKAIQARNAVSVETLLHHLETLRQQDGAEPPPANPAATTAGPSPATRAAAAGPQSAAPGPAVATPSPPASSPASGSVAPQPAATDAPSLTALWDALLAAVGKESRFARSYLEKGTPISCVDRLLTIGYDPSALDTLQLVDSTRYHTLLQTKLQDLGIPGARVKFVKTDGPTAVPATTSATAPKPPAPSPAPKPSPPRAAAAEQGPAVAPSPPESQPTKAKPVKLDPNEFKNDPLIKEALEVFKGQIVEVLA